MKKSASFVATLAVPIVIGLAAIGLGSVTHAAKSAKTMKAGQITCEEFLALGSEAQPRVVYWLDGLSKSGKFEEAEIDVDTLERPVAAIVTECHKAGAASGPARGRTRMSTPRIRGLYGLGINDAEPPDA
jgi:hypothetical protein